MQNNKYITLDDSNDFRAIAKKFSSNGLKMNHATARNIYARAVEEIAKGVMTELNIDIDKKAIKNLANSQEIHDALYDLIPEIIKEEKEGK